ncbi:hypothetical protein AB4851_08245 [Burkholderia sp. 22PA0099]|uniref:hypothetical protein n=1 Tax=Burkholderia sp. 22PA0099 TaxID=3237372 RepID=UPI0039C01A1C
MVTKMPKALLNESTVEPTSSSTQSRKPRNSGYKRQPYIKEAVTIAPTPPVEKVSTLTPEDEALIQRTDFRILELSRPFVRPSALSIPKHDVYGWPMDSAYTSILEARTSSFATRGTLPSITDERVFEALSMGEFVIQLSLMFNPYVLGFREQYPVVNDAAYQRAAEQGKRLPRSKLTTIDLLVTHLIPGSLDIHFHMVNVKHASFEPTGKKLEADTRRQLKERRVADQSSWTWERLRSDSIPRQEVVNYAFLWSLTRTSKIRHLYDASSVLASQFRTHSVAGSLDETLKRRARSLNISLHEAYRLFASCVAYGFVTLDHTKPLDKHLPIPFLPTV